jgi:hypothetical protein
MSFPEPLLGQGSVPIYHFSEDEVGLGRLDLVRVKPTPLPLLLCAFEQHCFCNS